MSALHNGNFDCDIFVDLQKRSDTVDHEILLKKVNFSCIRGIDCQAMVLFLFNEISIYFVITNAMLYEIRDYVNHNTLKAIYFAIFESQMNYLSIIWGKNL